MLSPNYLGNRGSSNTTEYLILQLPYNSKVIFVTWSFKAQQPLRHENKTKVFGKIQDLNGIRYSETNFSERSNLKDFKEIQQNLNTSRKYLLFL